MAAWKSTIYFSRVGRQILFYLLIIAAAAVAIILLRPRPRFVVTVRLGMASVNPPGKVPPRFLEFCLVRCMEQGIVRARISGFQTRRGITLRFSKSIPERDRQKFHNVWNAEA